MVIFWKVAKNKNREEKEEKREEQIDALSTLGIDISIKKLLADDHWKHQIHSIARGKDLEGAARAAFLWLEKRNVAFPRASNDSRLYA